MTLLFAFALCAPAFAGPPLSGSQTSGGKTEVALGPRFAGAAGGEMAVVLQFTLPTGTYIDKQNIGVDVASPEGWKVTSTQTPPGTMKSVAGISTEVLTTSFEASAQVAIPADAAPGDHELKLNVFYVTCTGDICIPHRETKPTQIAVTASVPGGTTPSVPPNSSQPPEAETPGGSSTESPSSSASTTEKLTVGERLARDLKDRLDRGEYVLPLGMLFLGGILLAMTPCVLPIIPIVVNVLVGGNQATKGQRVTASLVYTLGLALIYATLGLVAGLTGGLIGAVLQSPIVLTAFAVLFGILALSMFGLFELQLPASIQNKFQFRSQGGLLGAFVMGLVSGLIASPCIGPFLVTVLAWISTTKNAVFGFVALFTMGVGLGSPFVAAAWVGGRVLKPGPWMITVKKVLGATLLLGSAYFVNLVAHWPGLLAAIGMWAILAVIALYLLPRAESGTPNHERITGTLQGGNWGVLMTLVFGLGFAGLPDQNEGQAGAGGNGSTGIQWRLDVDAALADAKAQGKPALLYFTADWCIPCKELQHGLFQESEVIADTRRFICVKADVTDGSDPKVAELAKRYSVSGPPMVFFHDRTGARRETSALEALNGLDSINANLLSRMRGLK